MNIRRAPPILLFAVAAALFGATGHSVIATSAAAIAALAAALAILRRSPTAVTGALVIDVLAYGLYLGHSTAGLAVHAALAAIFFVAATLAYDAADTSAEGPVYTVPPALATVVALAAIVPIVLRTARSGVVGSVGGGWLAGSAALAVLALIAVLVRAVSPRA